MTKEDNYVEELRKSLEEARKQGLTEVTIDGRDWCYVMNQKGQYGWYSSMQE